MVEEEFKCKFCGQKEGTMVLTMIKGVPETVCNPCYVKHWDKIDRIPGEV